MPHHPNITMHRPKHNDKGGSGFDCLLKSTKHRKVRLTTSMNISLNSTGEASLTQYTTIAFHQPQYRSIEPIITRKSACDYYARTLENELKYFKMEIEKKYSQSAANRCYVFPIRPISATEYENELKYNECYDSYSIFSIK